MTRNRWDAVREHGPTVLVAVAATVLLLLILIPRR